MPLTDELRSRLDSTIASNKIVLFMKGTKTMPQCGFSSREQLWQCPSCRSWETVAPIESLSLLSMFG